jgi:hypothetical protein
VADFDTPAHVAVIATVVLTATFVVVIVKTGEYL